MADDVKDPIVDDDPEPEGVIEIETPSDGGVKVKQAVVPASAIKAERARIRKVEAEKQAVLQKQLDDERAAKQQLATDLNEIRPYVEKLKSKPELMKADEPAEFAGITDQEAEQYARDYELYTANGLDVVRAKRIIARENRRVSEASMRAAAEAIKPALQSTARADSRQNFLWAANQKDANGDPLVDPEILARAWAQLPEHLTADPEVAQERLRYAIGETLLQGKRPQRRQEPQFSEPAGGHRDRAYEMSPMERHIAENQGISEKEWVAGAKRYQPGRINRLGDTNDR